MAGRVYSYLRFSDPRQATGSSSERQAAYAAKWAAEHGLLLDETLSLRDEGLSAYHQRHVKTGALGAFLQAVEAGQVAAGSVLVVEGLDRLSRAEPIQAQAQLAQIVNAGVTVVTASDGKEYSRERLKANPMDLVYSLLVMIRAHEESDTKSKRVKAAIRRQCEGWMAGTFRGVIRNGKDPAWVELTPEGWKLVPHRVEAVRLALQLYQEGYGATKIVDELEARQLHMTTRGAQALQIYRLVNQRALIGEREFEIDGTTYRLPGYYPALLTQDEWDQLQGLAEDRHRRKVKGDIPGVITGLRLAVCGYCGSAVVGQNDANKRKSKDEHGKIRDTYRRLRCWQNFHGEGCKVGCSSSVAPIERALMNYCSDMINLQRLQGRDLTAGAREVVSQLRAELATVDAQLERLMDAMLGDTDKAPATFRKRAHDLEEQQASLQKSLARAERDLANQARTDMTGMDDAWKQLTAGVVALDKDARIKARQLVADTFEKLVIYWAGVRPADTPKGTQDVLLVAKGGASRLLRINAEGQWLDLEDVEAEAA